MRRRPKDDDELRLGDRVVAVESIGEVEEGTTGVVKVADGLTWVRYWIHWDTGRWTGWVTQRQLVRADLAQSMQPAKTPEVESNAPGSGEDVKVVEDMKTAAAGPQGESASGAATASVPAHLLERSRAAKARKASAG